MERQRVDNEGVEIEYLTAGTTGRKTPVIFIPGFLNPASMWSREMEALRPRRTIAVSLRGRGGSEAPPSGYRFEHQLSDVAAVLAAESLETFAVVAWSRGVPFAVAAASGHADKVRGLVLIDHPPVYEPIPREWLNEAAEVAPEHPQALRGLQREAVRVDLWDQAAELSCPVLVVYGQREDSFLSTGDAERYRRTLRNGEVLGWADAGHDVRPSDYTRFVEAIRAFLNNVDRGEQQPGSKSL